MAKARAASYDPEARAEFSAAVRWYGRRSRAAGPAFRAAVRRQVGLVLQFPGLGELEDEPHRIVLVEGFPYAIIYRETPDGIRVVAVAHAAREPGHWAGRE